MAGNTTAEATTLGRLVRSAKEEQPFAFAFALSRTPAESALAVDKSKSPKSLEADAKKTAGSGAKVFSGQVFCDGSEAIFLTDDAPSNGAKGITDWLKHHKISLSVDISKPEAPSQGEEDEEGPKIYATETLISRFRFAQRNPVNFAFGPGKEKDNALLALHPRRGGKMMFRGIKRENHAIRGAWGVLEMEGRIAIFRCEEKPIPGLRKMIRAFLRGRDLRFRVKIFGPEGEVVEPGDEEEDAADLQETPQEQSGQQEQSPSPPGGPQTEQQTPAPQDDAIGPDAQRLAQMRDQMQRMLDPLKEIAQKVPTRSTAIREQYGAFEAAVKARDVGTAQTALDALREQGRTGRADMQALATMRERLDGMLSQLQQLFQQRPNDAEYIRTMWKQCDAALKAGSVAEAREALFELAAIAKPPVNPATDGAPERGTVQFRQLLLRWKGAQTTLEANVKDLASALLADAGVQADPRFDDVKGLIGDLHTLLPSFGEDLQDAVDDIINAGPQAKEQGLFRPAVTVVDNYLRELSDYPELTGMDEIASMLGVSLKFDSVLRDSLREIRATLTAAA